MSRTCLFVINGLGLGNSTRCHAVMEHLLEAGCRIHVLTSGNGLAYLKDKPGIESLTSMESFYYSGTNGGISGWSTLKSIRRLLSIAKAKKAQLAELLEHLQPDVAVIDSEYAIGPLKRRHIPIVGLNTSEMIVSEYLECPQIPHGIRSHFWFVEFSDYLFHRFNCNLVLSPYPVRAHSRHPKFRRIGLIARRAIREQAPPPGPRAFPSPRQLRRVVFMLSGSVHASHIRFNGQELPFAIDVVGRPGESSGKVTFHGRQLNNAHLLKQADALVINGGYSAVSEAFVLRKPTFVVPVPGHAEQFVNARLVQKLGLGFQATEETVLDQLLSLWQQDRWGDLEPMSAAFEYDGAREAAEAILTTAGAPVAAPLPRAALGKTPNPPRLREAGSRS